MFRSHLRTAIAAAVVTALVTAGGAYAVDVVLNPGASAVVVEKPVTIKAGERNPVDFPGLRGDKAGEPLPKGYVAVGYRVSVTQGREFLYPSFTVSCPRGRRLVTFAGDGPVTMQLVGPNPFTRRTGVGYRGKRSWAIIVRYNDNEIRSGQTISATIYALCR